MKWSLLDGNEKSHVLCCAEFRPKVNICSIFMFDIHFKENLHQRWINGPNDSWSVNHKIKHEATTSWKEKDMKKQFRFVGQRNRTIRCRTEWLRGAWRPTMCRDSLGNPIKYRIHLARITFSSLPSSSLKNIENTSGTWRYSNPHADAMLSSPRSRPDHDEWKVHHFFKHSIAIPRDRFSIFEIQGQRSWPWPRDARARLCSAHDVRPVRKLGNIILDRELINLSPFAPYASVLNATEIFIQRRSQWFCDLQRKPHLYVSKE